MVHRLLQLPSFPLQSIVAAYSANKELLRIHLQEERASIQNDEYEYETQDESYLNSPTFLQYPDALEDPTKHRFECRSNLDSRQWKPALDDIPSAIVVFAGSEMNHIGFLGSVKCSLHPQPRG